MNTQEERSIFRLAAVLYADDNFNISRQQLLKKILENALFEMKSSEWVDVSDVAEFIRDSYSLTFTEDEIVSIAMNPKYCEKVFRIYNETINKTNIALSPNRIDTLQRKSSPPTIECYMEKFAIHKNLDKSIINSILTRFLYAVFTQNIENFKRLLDHTDTLSFSDECTADFTDDEKSLCLPVNSDVGHRWYRFP